MSIIEYSKNTDIEIMNGLLKNFKSKTEDIELLQLLEFMTDKMNDLLKSKTKEITNTKKITQVEKNEFCIKEYKVTAKKLYLIIDDKTALEYIFTEETLSKCYEIINNGRIQKSDIGSIFNKILL